MVSDEHSNPYRSPEADSTEEEPAPRKFRWRVVPTALLTIFAPLGLLGCVGMATHFLVSTWTSDAPIHAQEYAYPFSTIGFGIVALTLILGNIAGCVAAWTCWRGEWVSTAILVSLYLAITIGITWLMENAGLPS